MSPIFGDHFETLAELSRGAEESMGPSISEACRVVADAVLAKRTVFTFGNGGSATQALHFAAELLVRYKEDRPALPAVALNADVATLTACANDYDFSAVYARQLEGLGRPGDVAVGLSTSGRSPNVLKARDAARTIGLTTLLFTGEKGREEAVRWDVGLVVPSLETAHVQEIHLAVIHVICRHVDAERKRREASSRL